MVKVNVLQGENVTSKIQSVDDGGVTLVPEITVKKGMKPKQGEPVKFPVLRQDPQWKSRDRVQPPRRGRPGERKQWTF